MGFVLLHAAVIAAAQQRACGKLMESKKPFSSDSRKVPRLQSGNTIRTDRSNFFLVKHPCFHFWYMVMMTLCLYLNVG